jgi:hypothetical protein
MTSRFFGVAIKHSGLGILERNLSRIQGYTSTPPIVRDVQKSIDSVHESNYATTTGSTWDFVKDAPSIYLKPQEDETVGVIELKLRQEI